MNKVLSLLLVVFSLCCFGQAEQFVRAKILLSDGKTIRDVQRLGVAVDHGEFKKGVSFTSDFSISEIEQLKQAGFTVEVLIDDVQKYYREQNLTPSPIGKKKASTGCVSAERKVPVKPAHFRLGSYAGYYTYQDLLSIIDSMRLLYPSLISVKQPIDTFKSIEGRPIYHLKISNLPDSNQAAKPQVLYTALHHAREPASISQLVYYMWYLLENYATDAQVKAVVDNTELYFVPCLNPDGYIFNQTNNPNGGGMWRKNRRDNKDGTFGVDLNRNYAYYWGYDNVGSSDQSSSDVYRGKAGFSEPETKAVEWLCEQHRFLINLNYHTYGNLVIYPWGFEASYKTPDSTLFDAYGDFLTRFNQYKYGTGDQTVGYVTNGDSDDWIYGEQTTKNKTYAITPEVGSAEFGFYPPANEIEGVCEENLFANLDAAKLLLRYARIQSKSAPIVASFNNNATYNVQRLGLENGATFTVSIAALDAWITAVGNAKTYQNVSLLQSIQDSISYTLNPAIQPGQTFRYLLKVNNGLYDELDTVSVIFNSSTKKLAIGTDNLLQWQASTGGWNATNLTYYSPSFSVTDSRFGNYNDDETNTITLLNEIDLNNAESPALSFYAKWQLERDYDFVVVEVTKNNGASWTPLCGKYTRSGTVYQLKDEPIYDGDFLNGWVKELMPLDDYLNQKIRIRFRLVADQAVNFDGFYFDDVEVLGVSGISAISDINEQGNFVQVFPNPAANMLAVHQQQGISSIEVLNAIGEVVLRDNYPNISSEINIHVVTLTAGVYVLTAVDATGARHQARFVKARD